MNKLAVVIFAALAGCGGGGGAADQAMARMQAARDQVCACKDLACTEKAKAEFKGWIAKNKERLKKVAEQSKAYQERFDGLSDEADACITRIEEATPGFTPPPPEFVDPPPPTGEATAVPSPPPSPPPTPAPAPP